MKRKLMAMLLIVCMLFGSSLTSFAADGVTPNSITGSTSGNSTVSGSGDVSYVNTKVYSVTLPTSTAMNLVIDPQGLSGMVSGNEYSTTQLESFAGLITTSRPVYVANFSSVPMTITVDMQLTTTGSTNAASVVEDVASVSGNGNNILLYAIPSNVDTNGTTSGNNSDFTPAAKALVVTGSSLQAKFVLDEAEYVFYQDPTTGVTSYRPKTNGVKHGFALKFEGKVNKDADWSDYIGSNPANKISYSAVFSFAPKASSDAAVSGNGYGFMSYNKVIDIVPANAAPTFTAGSTAGVINYTPGSGDKGLKEIKYINVPNGTGSKYYDAYKASTDTSTTWEAATKANGAITFDEGVLTFFSKSTTDTKVVKIGYVNNAGQDQVVELTIKIK